MLKDLNNEAVNAYLLNKSRAKELSLVRTMKLGNVNKATY